eukprot:5409509-Pleurochrysis_carterae.AAC.1
MLRDVENTSTPNGTRAAPPLPAQSCCTPNGTRTVSPLPHLTSASRRSRARHYCTSLARIRERLSVASDTPTTPVKRNSSVSPGSLLPKRASRTAMVDLQAALKLQNSIENRPWYVLSPESRFSSCWDGLTMLALLYTALVTPFEVSFLRAADTVDAL